MMFETPHKSGHKIWPKGFHYPTIQPSFLYSLLHLGPNLLWSYFSVRCFKPLNNMKVRERNIEQP